MKAVFIIYNHSNGLVYSESEFMWSHCVGTFYETEEAAQAVMERDKLDKYVVGTIKLYDF